MKTKKELTQEIKDEMSKLEMAIKKMNEHYALAEKWRKIKIELENKIKQS